MKLSVSSAAKRFGIVAPQALWVEGIVVKNTPPALLAKAERLGRSLNDARFRDALLAQKEVLGFRDIFSAQGYPKQVPAGEKLVSLVHKKGFKSIKNIVDAYNIEAIAHASGIGGHAVDNFAGTLQIDCAQPDERVRPMFKDKDKAIPEGDLLYRLDGQVMAWLGQNDVDADAFRIDETSKSVLFVILGNAATSPEHNREIGNKILDNIWLSCSVGRSAFLDVCDI